MALERFGSLREKLEGALDSQVKIENTRYFATHFPLPNPPRLEGIALSYRVPYSYGPNTRVKEAILESRQSRIESERGHNRFQGWMRSRLGWWVVKPAIEFIPSHFGYGPGDAVTLISAVAKEDILTGEKLDSTDRKLYFIAAGIPFVPSLAVIGPARLLRRRVEDTVHSAETEDKQGVLKNSKGVLDGFKEITKVIRSIRR